MRTTASRSRARIPRVGEGGPRRDDARDEGRDREGPAADPHAITPRPATSRALRAKTETGSLPRTGAVLAHDAIARGGRWAPVAARVVTDGSGGPGRERLPA